MTAPVQLPPLDFSGQTALVTGTTNGLGRSISDELVKRNIGTLIMGVRSVARGEEVKTELLMLNSKVTVYVIELQMDDTKSVVAFCKTVKELSTTLDIALMNAGLGGYEFQLARSGHENIMQVNVYSNAFLALALMPLLEQTARSKGRPSRLTWVGSFVQMDHTLTKKPLLPNEPIVAQLDDETRFNKSRYQDSKLMSTMLIEQLAQRTSRDHVIFNEVSPGPVLTNFGSTYPAYFRIAIAIVGHFVNKAKSIAEGTNKYLHAIAVVGEESHGRYISDYKITSRAPIAETPLGKEIAAKFFTEILEMCKMADASSIGSFES